MLERRDYQCELVLRSPLHIGDGTWREDRLPPAEDGRPTQVAAIQRDHAGQPWIPGSTLKGAFAALARAQGLAEAEALFGQIKTDDSGQMGALLLRGASLTGAGPTEGLPCAAGGVYVASRTAMDAGRGIAAPNKLFHAEAVAPGARFALRLRLETQGDIAALERAVLLLLGVFAGLEGVAIGKDQGSGQGRLQLLGQVSVTEWRARSGHLRPDKPRAVTPAAPPVVQGVTLRLVCDGPYLSRDPAWTADTRRARELEIGDKDLPHLRALRLKDAPVVTGQAVAGALRARASWLQAAALVAEGKPVPPPTDHLASIAAACRLTPQERLFGVTGFRGVLTVGVGATTRKGRAGMTSVKIDRFAGGGIDNALFSLDTDHGVGFDLTLTLDARATDKDHRALKALLADLRANGLTLGHGTSRGFGWFRVEG